MAKPDILALSVAALLAGIGAALGQGPYPIADNVTDSLTPSGISELDIKLDGDLVYLFEAEDSSNVAHFLGGFTLRQGKHGHDLLTAREAVVWISENEYEGTAYRHLDILLWRDALINETGGTLTSGPALFVTLNTAGAVELGADDLAYQSSAQQDVYRNGYAIREALARADMLDENVDSSLRVLDTTGLSIRGKRPKVKPPVVFQSPGELSTHRIGERELITVIGGAYLSRGDPKGDEYLEIRADSVVVYLPAPESESDDAEVGNVRRGRRGPDPNQQLMAGATGEREVEGVYLEGDVRMQQGTIQVRTDRLYYDFQQERAMIIDAVMHTTLQGRDIPIYLRASEVRQLSPTEFTAKDAMVSTSEFHTPHYHIGAKHVQLINRSPMEPTGESGTVQAGTFALRDATFNLNNVPILWWPLLRGDLDATQSAVRRISMGYSDDFGAEIETSWHLFNVLGLEKPDGFDGSLELDYYSERGPAAGVNVEYERENYFGEIKTYFMHDDGEDNLGRRRTEPSRSDWRGRALLRHRQYLSDDWQVSFELSYISDEGFLEEYFEKEFDNDKEQETLVYLKKQRDNWAFTATAQTRIMDFTTQTERFPDTGFFLAGESLGGVANLYSENRAGFVRYRTKDPLLEELLFTDRPDSSGKVGRADSRQELTFPFDIGDLRLVPFTAVRGTAYDDTPDDGGVGRLFGSAGVRGSLYFSKTYPNVCSQMFDINGVRHVIKTDFVGWVSDTNYDTDEMFPFDSTVGGEVVESIEGTSGVQVGVRQRWQTKRGEGENRRTVDFVTLDVELGAFDSATGQYTTNGYTSFSRPENSIAHNYVNTATVWRINDRTAFLSEMNYDMNDGEIDILNFSLAVERTPRFSYLVGYRFIEESDSNILALDLNYRLTEKHTFAMRELFDLQSGRTLDFTVGIIRKFPRWYGALAFEFDDARDDLGVSVSFWPEGLPNAAIGSKRFTGLATSTRLKND
ncbi:MAG: LPS assembly protein LptD [Planctomycetota bacterium]|jgi:hypothetical protein